MGKVDHSFLRKGRPATVLRHINMLPNGSYEFRKRFPRSSGLPGEFKRRFRARDAATMAREYARIVAEYDCRVSGKGKAGSSAHAPVPAVSVVPLVPVTVPAVPLVSTVPVVPEVTKTLADAAELYLSDKLRKGRDIQGTHFLNRIRKHMEAATGITFEKFPLDQLTRKHARDTRDYMLRMTKRDGDVISPNSVSRWLSILSAMINYALDEFDLTDTCRNPFRALPMNVSSDIGAIDRRDTLPDDVVPAMTSKLTGDLRLIWRILAGTGCRVAEVTGLRVEDVCLDGDHPHLSIEGHSGRRLKTSSSVRLVPLVGDALSAAKEAVLMSTGSGPLFPRYARLRGSDAASAILMKHLRGITKDKKHVVHSLRHRMKDKLRLAGISKDVQDMILGHASASVAEGYGSASARLIVAYRAMSDLSE